MEKFRREKYLIDRSFQLKYLALIVSLLLFHTLMVLAAVFGPTVYVLYSNLPLEQKTEAARSLLHLHKTIWPAIFAVITLFGVLSIFVTHKMAGPLFNIISKLREFASGNYSIRINLRKGDELNELADQVNIIADLFNESRTRLIQKQELIDKALAGLKQEIYATKPDSSAAIKFIEAIEAENAEVSSILIPGCENSPVTKIKN